MRPDDTATAIRAQLIAALEQRAAAVDGEARRVLDARLAELRALHADAMDNASDAAPERRQPGPLRELVDQLAREAPADRASYPELPALTDFRQRWSTLRADSQLQHSVAHIPTDAGPLNSTALASRAIALMRELSPGYLRAFLAYVDDLAWLEQVGSASPATGSTSARKRTPRKPLQ
ncbi:hypothetical protein ATSB10_28260 [Dyella thiooxydans]|uniref:DUF2894 domain-containing protein n=1 Tax=Dyella thiooxydans TaxID=445710 RepID=A0A160N357_9GAMM|nr:DUF2894 domain-containing protein [Dyella thiooxydans]AND70280.1 hypothetical protein ATSB10_28260 [Dyella thiooxydans]